MKSRNYTAKVKKYIYFFVETDYYAQMPIQGIIESKIYKVRNDKENESFSLSHTHRGDSNRIIR